jgi:uncharacterized protein DUF397
MSYREESGMPDPDPASATWLRSTRCTNGDCVEVAFLGGEVAIRDSKDKSGPVLLFSEAEWEAFVDSARRGRFDLGQGDRARG